MPDLMPPLIHRLGNITSPRVEHFVSRFLHAALLQSEGAHYDATYAAFADSKLEPPPPLVICGEVHEDTRQQRLIAVADELVRVMLEDPSVQSALQAAFAGVLRRLTGPTPKTPLTPADVDAFYLCSGEDDLRRHLDDYDR